jgi:hypothetical protein
VSAEPADTGRPTDTACLAISDLKISLGHREVVRFEAAPGLALQWP